MSNSTKTNAFNTNKVTTESNIVILDNEGKSLPFDFFASEEIDFIKKKHKKCVERGWVEDNGNPVYYIHHIVELGVYFHSEPFKITSEGMPRSLDTWDPIDPIFSVDRWFGDPNNLPNE